MPRILRAMSDALPAGEHGEGEQGAETTNFDYVQEVLARDPGTQDPLSARSAVGRDAYVAGRDIYITLPPGPMASGENRPPAVVFESRPSYPSLEFSVVNGSSIPIQVTAIRVVKAASIKADSDIADFLTGPRLKLDFDLRLAAQGRWASAFSGQVSNLAPHESEAFILDLSVENTLNLVDIELECVSSTSPRAFTVRPSEIIFVCPPYSRLRSAGSIQLIARSEALSALLGETAVPLRGPVADSYPAEIETLFLRGAAHLCFGEILEGWNRISEMFGEGPALGPAAASFAEFGRDHGLDSSVREALERWVGNPRVVRKAHRWDNESHTLIVQEFLIDGLPSRPTGRGFEITQGAAKWLSLLDSTIDIPEWSGDRDEDEAAPDPWGDVADIMGEVTLHENRKALLQRLVDCYGKGAVEYLIVNLGLVSNAIDGYVRLLAGALGDESASASPSGVDAILEKWRTWWDVNRNVSLYSRLQWRPYSPRLARAAAALFAKAPKDVPADMDSLVKMAAVRNPRVIGHFAAKLAKTPEGEIRMELAISRYTPPGVLAILADDPHSGVRRWVASNPKTDDRTLRKLGRDKSEIVRSFLAQNPRLNGEMPNS